MFCAVLAAAGNYSVAHAQRTGQDDQAALAVPRVAIYGAQGVAMPQPLAPSEAARIKRILTLQSAGSFAEARRETDHLEQDVLLGPLLADRYLNPGYRPSTAELSTWLEHYGDQPDAPAIAAVLERLSPQPTPDRPQPPRKARAAPGQVHALLVANRDADAVASARPLLSGGDPGALIDGGLAGFRLGDPRLAGEFFAAAYRSASGGELRAKAAYWLSRTQQEAGQRSAATVWLRLAAREEDSFYGLIARRALGLSFACMTGQTLGTADVDALRATQAGQRAFALLQVGEKRRAEAEFRLIWLDGGETPTLGRALLLLARAAGLPRLAAELEPVEAISERAPGGKLPHLQPAGGFVVDPALVYALVRHESNFRAGVVSRSGAKGLMQLMPGTARAVAGGEASRLGDPAVNLDIGQRYILALADDEAVDGDLIRLLAGYNQGAFALRRWVGQVRDGGDPLLFLEAMPNAAARAFVEEALELSWHYASLLHQPAASLDDLAAGRHPRLVRAGEAAAPCPRPIASR